MRITIILGLLLSLSQIIFAAPNHVTPTIKEVTIYRSGAKITSVARVSIPAGKSEVFFDNQSPYFNANSLQVKLGGGATLNAAIFQMKTPAPAPESPRIQTIRDSIVLLNDLIWALNLEMDVYNKEDAIIAHNANLIGTIPEGKTDPRLSVSELRELTDFYRSRMLNLKKLNQSVQIAIRNQRAHVKLLEDELQTLYPNAANRTGEIVLKVESSTAQTVEITCTYLVQNAYWIPLYDLRSEGLDQPLKLVYKANVINNTGFDWKNVKVTLSSATPLVNNNRPILYPVFVDFRVQRVYQDEVVRNMDVMRSNVYQMKEAAPNMAGAELMDKLTDDTVVEEAQEEFLTTFDIAKAQDIAADGQSNIITVEEKEMAAIYQYHAVPKVEPAVFLLAKIIDYGKYNLLPGTANIFFRETYVGQTTVNPNVTSDTLLLSLGRDEQITIKRVQPKDFTERKKVLSNTIKETYAFEITVKNNKTVPINIEFIDQVPISKQETIEVEVIDKDGAEYAPTYGKLTWKLDVKPGQNKKVRFSYSTKYPKDKNVSILKG
jgi:uncharacterized protein (TIGR02231 family)